MARSRTLLALARRHEHASRDTIGTINGNGLTIGEDEQTLRLKSDIAEVQNQLARLQSVQ